MTKELFFIDTSRQKNHTKQRSYSEQLKAHATRIYSGWEQVAAHIDQDIEQKSPEAIVLRSGDGTTSHLITVSMRAFEKTGNLPPFVLTGGGSANTFLHDVVHQKEVGIPVNLQDLFPPESYSAYRYFPPELTYADGSTQSIVYLFGACHLAVKGTYWVDRLSETNEKAMDVYTKAGIKTITEVFSPYLRPRLLRYIQNDRVFNSTLDTSPLNVVIAIPRLGTFEFRDRIAPDKLWSLTIPGDQRLAKLRYVAMAIIGTTFPHGPDLAIRLGLIDRKVVSEATIMPDSDWNGVPNENTNIDGQLQSISGEVTIRRQKQGVLFLAHRELLHEISVKK